MDLLEKELQVVWLDKRRNAVAQVHDPATLFVCPVEPFHHVRYRLRYRLMGTVQDTRIGVALENDIAVAAQLVGLGRIIEPVQTDDVVP